MGTVECPGGLGQVDPVRLNHTGLGIDIKTGSEGTTSSTGYCPSCWPKVWAVDQDKLLDGLEALVRNLISVGKASQQQ